MKSRQLEVSEVGLIVAALRLQAQMATNYREESSILARELITVHVFVVEDDSDAAMLVSLIENPVGNVALESQNNTKSRTLQTDLLEDR